MNEVDEAEKEIRTKYFRYRDRYNFHVKSLHLYHNAPEVGCFLAANLGMIML